MEKTAFGYKITADIKLTEADIKHLTICSGLHYDGKCQAASKQGGFIYGWNNRLSWAIEDAKKVEGATPTIEVEVNTDEVGTIAKILELETSAPGLERHTPQSSFQFFAWQRLLIEMGEEWKKLNAHR